MEFKSNEIVDNIVIDFINNFEREINDEIFRIKVNNLQQNTREFKKNIFNFVNKYKSIVPSVNKLNDFFNELNENEYFFYFQMKNYQMNR